MSNMNISISISIYFPQILILVSNMGILDIAHAYLQPVLTSVHPSTAAGATIHPFTQQQQQQQQLTD
jgi:hypothetical protein